MRTVKRDRLPKCDICHKANNVIYDAPYQSGRWAYQCPMCYINTVPVIRMLKFKPQPKKVFTSEQLKKHVLKSLDIENVEDFLLASGLDLIVPGVCKACAYICESCKPDATRNWCPNCKENRVISILVLWGYM